MSEWLGFLLSATGATLGIVGVLMMARTYHPFKFPEFAKLGLWMAWKLLSQSPDSVTKSTEVAAKLGSINAECRGYSLLGLYLVFLGFCFQLLGTAVTFIAGRP